MQTSSDLDAQALRCHPVDLMDHTSCLIGMPELCSLACSMVAVCLEKASSQMTQAWCGSVLEPGQTPCNMDMSITA